MSNAPTSPVLPILISSGPASLSVALRAAQYYHSELAGAFDLVLLRPQACADTALPFGLKIRCVDDEEVPGFTRVRDRLVALAGELRAFGRSPGWYLQQYLKLAGVRHIAPKGAWLTDGDTIFSTDLLKAVANQPVVLTTNEEFRNYNRLVAAIGLTPFDESCVANGNIFYPALLPTTVMEADGFLELIERHVIASRGTADFSEYQLMGSIAAPMLGSRRIRIFRRFDLLAHAGATPSLKRITQALHHYDAIAIEHGHRRSLGKRIVAGLLFHLHYSW